MNFEEDFGVNFKEDFVVNFGEDFVVNFDENFEVNLFFIYTLSAREKSPWEKFTSSCFGG